MANKEKMGPPTLEMIQGNPYNYTFDEVAKCMGEERAKSLFKTLYKNGVSPKNQTMTIKDIYVGGDTTKYAFELQDGYCIETVCIKRRTGNTVCVHYGRLSGGVYFLCIRKKWIYSQSFTS